MNVFVKLHEARYGSAGRRLGDGWENLFTEQFAFFLSADRCAATAVARVLLSSNDVSVIGVHTQTGVALGTPDLRFDLQEGPPLHVEHKFDSPLGPAQLERYLKCVDRLALVTDRNQNVAEGVVNCERYMRPPAPGRDYFRWTDIYSALVQAQDPPPGYQSLRLHFMDYMRQLALHPLPVTFERLFGGRTTEANRIVQRAFGHQLAPVRHALRGMGFRVSDVSHKGKMAYATAGHAWRHLYVKPEVISSDRLDERDINTFEPDYAALVVEAVFDKVDEELVRKTCSSLQAESAGDPLLWKVLAPTPIGTTRVRLGLATPLRRFGTLEDSAAMCAEALTAVGRLLSMIQIAGTTTQSPSPEAGQP